MAPDGTLYNIHNRTGGSADNVTGTFTKNLSTEAAQRHMEAARQRQRRWRHRQDRQLEHHVLILDGAHSWRKKAAGDDTRGETARTRAWPGFASLDRQRLRSCRGLRSSRGRGFGRGASMEVPLARVDIAVSATRISLHGEINETTDWNLAAAWPVHWRCRRRARRAACRVRPQPRAPGPGRAAPHAGRRRAAPACRGRAARGPPPAAAFRHAVLGGNDAAQCRRLGRPGCQYPGLAPARAVARTRCR